MKYKLVKFSGYILANENEELVHVYQGHRVETEPFDFDLRLDDENCDLAILEEHFKHDTPTESDRQVVVGGVYRHFKIGKLVKVIGVSKSSEFPTEMCVVYEHEGTLWHRPLDMFLSEVDHEKYPNATQKMRFEYVGMDY